MANCRYCGRSAGLFRSVHEDCIRREHEALDCIKKLMASAAVEMKEWRDISADVDQVSTAGYLSREEIHAALLEGWSGGTEERSKAAPVSPDDMKLIDNLWSDAGGTTQETQWTAGGWALMYSFLIWVVLNDQIAEFRRLQPYQGPGNFNLQAREIAVWGHPNVILKERRTSTSYVGGYNGMSVKVARGLYYRFGGLAGHRVESSAMEEVDFGDLLFTTQAIYFGGMQRRINFRLPYRQVIRFQPYADAVGVCDQTERIFFPLGAHTPAGMAVASNVDPGRLKILDPSRPRKVIRFPDCGWFLFNILQALASRATAVPVGSHR